MRRVTASILLSVLFMTMVTVGLAKPRQTSATIPAAILVDIQRWIEYFKNEAGKITMDEVRRIVVQQVTKKLVQKIIDELDVFVKNYKDYIYNESSSDTLRYVDSMFDRFFASYIDPAVKNAVKQYYYGDYVPVPNDCLDIDSINVGDGNSLEKTLKYLQ